MQVAACTASAKSHVSNPSSTQFATMGKAEQVDDSAGDHDCGMLDLILASDRIFNWVDQLQTPGLGAAR
jgi:hypothetical protein